MSPTLIFAEPRIPHCSHSSTWKCGAQEVGVRPDRCLTLKSLAIGPNSSCVSCNLNFTSPLSSSCTEGSREENRCKEEGQRVRNMGDVKRGQSSLILALDSVLFHSGLLPYRAVSWTRWRQPEKENARNLT